MKKIGRYRLCFNFVIDKNFWLRTVVEIVVLMEDKDADVDTSIWLLFGGIVTKIL